MKKSQYRLLGTRRFLPLFITQFFNAFNDNVFKNGFIILITYQLIQSENSQQFMIALIAGIFILPFFLFSATAGQLADKYEKSKIIVVIKSIELLFMMIASIGFYFHNLLLLMITLFFLGAHSTFFGPIKYSILPEQLNNDELLGGNALIEAGTFISILIGQVLGGTLILKSHGVFYLSLALLMIATAGLIGSLYIPKTKRAQPHLLISANFFKETKKILNLTHQKKSIFLAIFGISWFWFIGATFITQFPTFTKVLLSATPQVFTLILTLFSLGIGMGSLLCNLLLKGKISTKYVPLAIFGMSIFMVDIYLASGHLNAAPAHLYTVIEFVHYFSHIRILVDILLLSVCGGLYIVPLYAFIQKKSNKGIRSRIIAGNNIYNAIFMVTSSLYIMLFTAFNFSIPQLFLLSAILNTFVAIYLVKLLPEAILQTWIKWLCNLFYRVEVKGIEHYHQAGKRVVIIANHTSFIDAILLAAFLPNRLSFAVNTHIANSKSFRFISNLIEIFPINPSNPFAIKSIIKKLKENRRLVIFPEGRITVTGALMKIYEGPGLIADQANAKLLPIRIEGAQYTPFSRLKKKVHIRKFSKITLTILPPQEINLSAEIKGKERRQILGEKLYQIMSNMLFESSDYKKTLMQSLIDARKIHSGKHIILEDIQRKPITYNQLLQYCFVLASYWKTRINGPHVGILLPNIASNVINFFSLSAISHIPVMLNYTFSAQDILSCCLTSNVKQVITSEKFIDNAKLSPLIMLLQANAIEIHYLEHLKLIFRNKLIGFLKSRFPSFYSTQNGQAEKPAVVLFTSGSEGKPKGVVLSHQNIQANRYQLSARIDFTAQDIILNALPMFHSFGLSAGTLLPILFGMRTFLYPSPLHYKIVPEIIYDINATITFGTDTFLRGYGKFANPYDFYCLRYVLAGAEKLREETRNLWAEKFGIRLLEGYGATETSPVLSMNTPMHYRINTVGQLLPGVSYQIHAVPDLEQGGRLWVKGPNIMLGYYQHDLPGQLLPLKAGWYDTGDIVTIDEAGFLKILGRARRFAKIGGEMISLTAVENTILTCWPDYSHAIIAEPDPVKGEQLILFTTYEAATRQDLLKLFQRLGLTELQMPRKIIILATIPVLGTGKTHYVALKNYYRNYLAQD